MIFVFLCQLQGRIVHFGSLAWLNGAVDDSASFCCLISETIFVSDKLMFGDVM